ncbi:isochorismate synthase MenF [Rhizobium sp. L1K21]|uniref:isochorismate synthase n=1 Tax=Rhizobium sp. L1K21 TaxID=2954933 RepID=UPI0020927BB3|nr:isochorismate synthase MenF [Rhizobium sp. L1K21]MCO6187570.1 isochorismate synthase MenF [Rhizobium sp. L1K21]
MRSGALKTNQIAEDSQVEEATKFLFTSGSRALHARGIQRHIAAPARGSEHPESMLQISLKAAFAEAQRAGQANPIAIGAIPFDMREPSCLYVPETYEWRDLGSDESASADLQPTRLVEQRSIPDEAGFKRSVEHAILNFNHSDVRKAVLSVTRELQFDAPLNVEQLLANLRAQNKQGYQFRIPLDDGSTLIGVSPELLLRKEGNHIISNPLAGSARRDKDPALDRQAAAALEASEKDQYEHSLVIEDIRRVLTPHCSQINIPDAPSLINTATLWHLSTRIEGQVADPNVNAIQLASLLHPTPAVCGYPTEQAHRLIRFVEPFERGYFAGIVGWCDAQGNGEWVITIRCGMVREDTIRLFAGAGIVDASIPQSEWAEVQTKLRTMLNACGIAA